MPINIKDSIESSTIKGSLSGNASTATKATQDSAGQQINKTYIKGLSVSGKTITYTRGDGTTGTITTQDTNTTYSTGTASALGLTKLYTGTGTATDGTMTQNAINTALNGKAASNHTHSYLPLNGGSVTGRVNVGGRCILPPVYNYDKGTLINICAAAGQTMVTIHVTGNSYGAGLPINSMYHFYDYTQNEGIINASGVHNGYNIGNMTVYRNNGRLYAWIKQPASYQTFNIEIIANKTLDASISNAAVHTSGNTNTITITPSVASMNGHTHNYAGSSSAGGAANSANTLATARTINGTSFNGSANITTANWGTARTLTIGNTGKSVNGSGNVSWSLSEIGALPLTGGTLSGRLTANGRISAPTAGSSWISGMTVTNATIGISTQQATGSYHPVLAVKTSGNHVANIGGIGDDFGFYGFKSGRTENGTDWSFKINAGTGAVSSTGNITAPTFVGALSGNASTATKATQDSAGQQINKTYIKGLSVSGKTITYTKGDGTTGTITTQDTNTTYSTGTASALGLTKLYTGTGTATDGTMTQAAIKTALDGKAASSHTHNYAGSNSAGGSANKVNLPRLTGSSNTPNYLPGTSIFEIKEFASDCSNMPTAAWYHILTGQGSDSNYNTQLALGMTNQAVFYRYRNSGTWGSWKQLAFTDSSITGNAGTATKLATARTIKVGNTGKSFDGSGGITFTLAEMGIVSGTSAPSNSDGRADGTVYFRYA